MYATSIFDLSVDFLEAGGMPLYPILTFFVGFNLYFTQLLEHSEGALDSEDSDVVEQNGHKAPPKAENDQWDVMKESDL